MYFSGSLIANIQPIKIALAKRKRVSVSLYANRLLTVREHKTRSVKIDFVIMLASQKIVGLG